MAFLTLTVIPEEVEDTWSLADWLEKMADANPGGPATFGGQQMSCTEVIRVSAERAGGLQGKVRSCLQQVLGYSKADNDNYALLRPNVPVAHPKYPWLWADAASVQELGPLGNEEHVGSAAGTFKPKVDGVGNGYVAEGGTNARYRPEFTSNYASADISVRFSYYPWLVYGENDTFWTTVTPGEEWRRMCVMSERRPRLEMLSADGTEQGKFYYSEREAASDKPAAGPLTGTAFTGGVFVRKSTTTFTVVWRQVAEEYLCGQYESDPSNALIMPKFDRFDRYLGTVNSAEIWGQPKYTLLFADTWSVRYPQPVRVEDAGGNEYSFGLIAHDVYMVFEKFDPPRAANVEDYLGVAIADANRLRGHLVVPYRPDTGRKWYGATAGTTGAGGTAGTSTGTKLLEPLDFRDLFRHASDPAYPLP